MFRRSVSVLGAIAFLSISAPAYPQVPASDPTAADALFRDGREAMARGDLDTACSKFADSNVLEPSIGARLNLGDCEEKRGKVAKAWSLFQELARELPSTDDRKAIAEQRASAIASRVPRLTIRLAPSSPSGTIVTRNGAPLGAGSLGSSLPIDPGPVKVEARAPDRSPRVVEFTLAEGETKEITVMPGAAIAAAAPAVPKVPARSSSSGNGQRIGAAVAAGVGIVGIGIGTAFGIRALEKKSDSDAECRDGGALCSQDGLDIQDEGLTAATVSTVGFAVGGVGIAAAVVLFVTAPSKGEKASPAPAARLSVGPRGATLGGFF